MSQLIKIVPDTKPLPEPEGYEFGYYAFEELDPISTEKVQILSVTYNRGMTKQYQMILAYIGNSLPRKLERLNQLTNFCKVLLLAFRWSCLLCHCFSFISFAIVPEVFITLVMH